MPCVSSASPSSPTPVKNADPPCGGALSACADLACSAAESPGVGEGVVAGGGAARARTPPAAGRAAILSMPPLSWASRWRSKSSARSASTMPCRSHRTARLQHRTPPLASAVYSSGPWAPAAPGGEPAPDRVPASPSWASAGLLPKKRSALRGVAGSALRGSARFLK
jgi:hypothetical protein